MTRMGDMVYGHWKRSRLVENHSALSEYIPRLNYMSKIEIIVSKLKRHTNVKVVVLWLFGGYGKGFLKEAEKQNLVDRTWILSDALASEKGNR